jgi:hypothetical protein
MLNYYGDKISPNMQVTPEGYLLCLNTPLGRTGWMDYQGQEIPLSFNEPMGKKVRVYRSPEELFSPTTIASFEGKPVTNLHPVANLDVNTVSSIERGHAQNVRRDGEFLVADLYITDAGLISEIVNDLKREVSSGYDCSWHKIDGGYEQREIVGNHVAVVQNGRAGHKVAIHDAKPEETPDGVKSDPAKPIGRRKSMNLKDLKDKIMGNGFKQFVQDAEPEDIAKAIEAMKEDDAKDCHDKKVKDAEPEVPKKEEVKDEDPPAWFKAYKEEQDKAAKDRAAKDEESATSLKDLAAKIEALKSAEKKEEKAETADSVLDAMEEDLEKDETEEEKKEREKKEAADKKAKDSLTAPDPDAPKKTAADAVLHQIVHDMRPAIMAIPDEAARLEAAKKFRQGVQDIRGRAALNGYADILSAVSQNKKQAMDALNAQNTTVEERAEVACDNWNKAGEAMRKKA